MIQSPCIGVCRYEENTERDIERTCEGCSRTPEEIEEWYRASEGRRKEILHTIEKRKFDKEYKKDLTILLRTSKIHR